MVGRRPHPQHFLSHEEQRRLVAAIRTVEQDTSGEIRIHLDRNVRGHVLDRAKAVFQRQRLHQRTHRNAVLIYLSPADRSFAILGDAGIHQRVGEAFWKDIADSVRGYFSRDQFSEGLESAVHEIGRTLKTRFPR